jgi:hypothetical protein
MKPMRISQLSADQVDAVFRSDLFCQLTDGQVAALHHRLEQLKAQQHAVRQRKRQQRWLIAAAVVIAIAVMPFWQQALALTFVAAFWAVVFCSGWDGLQNVRAKLTRNKPMP